MFFYKISLNIITKNSVSNAVDSVTESDLNKLAFLIRYVPPSDNFLVVFSIKSGDMFKVSSYFSMLTCLL